MYLYNKASKGCGSSVYVALLTVFSRVFLGYSSSLLPWQSHLSSRLVAVSPLLSSQSASVSCHLQNFSLFLKRGCKRTWSVSGLIYDRYGLSWAFLALVCRSPFTLTLAKGFIRTTWCNCC